jgi:hypothetical protein
VPFVTKYWFGLTVLFTLMGRLSIIWGQWVVLQWHLDKCNFRLGVV